MSEKAPAPFLNLVVADALLRDFGLSINMSATAADKNGALWVSNDEHFGHIYIHRDAARAWQAVHDWLNGTPEHAALAKRLEEAERDVERLQSAVVDIAIADDLGRLRAENEALRKALLTLSDSAWTYACGDSKLVDIEDAINGARAIAAEKP